MKVLHIATTDYGGAGLGMINLHKSLLSKGIDSKILLAKKTTSSDTIFQMEPNFQMFHWSGNRVLRKVQSVARNRGYLKTQIEQLHDKMRMSSKLCDVPVCFTSPISTYDIVDHPLVKEADIIHLHWVGDFLDYKTFFTKIDKPIVWTLRDENPGLGGFHYRTDKIKYGKYYNEIEDAFFRIKENAIIDNKKLSLVALSDIMIDFCKSVSYLRDKKIYKIYNPIDSNDYFPTEKHIARQVLGIDDNVFAISFVSVFLSDHRKGLDNLMRAVEKLEFPVKILCVGRNDFFKGENKNVICYGSIENARLLSLIYSASDAFVNPTLKESFGKTNIEALMSGVPVISTAEGVSPEVIDDECGRLIEDADSQTIAEAIRCIKAKSYNRELIREKVMDLFSPDRIVKQHIDMYNEILSNNRNFINKMIE